MSTTKIELLSCAATNGQGIAQTTHCNPIRVQDHCLLDSLTFLRRNELDHLPLVSQQFNRLLSCQHFAIAPLRIYHNVNYHDGGTVTGQLDAGKILIERRGWLSSARGTGDFGDVHQCWKKNLVLSYENLVEMLKFTPWFRVRNAYIKLRLTSPHNPEQQLAAMISRCTPLTSLWKGFHLNIAISIPCDGLYSNRPLFRPIWSGTTLDIGQIASDCGTLELTGYATSPAISLATSLGPKLHPVDGTESRWRNEEYEQSVPGWACSLPAWNPVC